MNTDEPQAGSRPGEDFNLEQFRQETHEYLQRSRQSHEADVERKVARLRKREHDKWGSLRGLLYKEHEWSKD